MKQAKTGVTCALKQPHLVVLPLKKLYPAPYFVKKPPRDALSDLVESVRRYGLLSPPGVRRVRGKGRRYEVVFGVRRYYACRELGIKKIPCFVYPAQTRGEVLSLTENLQRAEDASEALLSQARLRGAEPVALCRAYSLPLPQKLERARKLNGIDLSGEPAPPAGEAPAPVRQIKAVFRDVRFITNSIDRALEFGKHAGFGVEAQKIERGREICYHIRLPREPELSAPPDYPCAG